MASERLALCPSAHLSTSAVNSTGRRKYRIIIDRSVRDPDTGFLNGIRLQVEARSMDQAEILATEVAASIKLRRHNSICCGSEN